LIVGPEPLARHHVLDQFDCGKPALTDWLRRYARMNQGAGMTQTYVIHVDNRVIGYYSLCPGSIQRESAIPRILKGISEIGRRYGLTVANVFHAGDGNLHPNLLFDRRDPDEVRRVEEASKEIMQLCVDAGGTITGEHGVGLDKRDYMPLIYGADELSTMWGVRRVFDPEDRMNPGKVLPSSSDPRGDSPLTSHREAAPV